MRLFLIASLVLSVLVSGCVRTKVSSFTDPSFVNRDQYESVLVTGSGLKLDERQAAEQAVAEAFAAQGVRVERGLAWFPPTRELSEQEAAQQLAKSGVQSLLVLQVKSLDVSETFVPPEYHPGTTYGTVNFVGNTAYLNTYTTPGYTSGGYSITKPTGEYTAILYDLATGQTAWQADVSAGGSAFSNYTDLMVAVARNAVTRLKEDGLF